MNNETSKPCAAGLFAAAIGAALEARSREIARAWQEALHRQAPLAGAAGETAKARPRHADEAAAGLVRAIARSLADGPEEDAGATVDREVAALARARSAPGRSPADLTLDLGILHEAMLGAVGEFLSRGGEPSSGSLVVEVARRLVRAHASAVDAALRLVEREAAAARRARTALLVTFARSVTHELRNRVNAIRLSSSVFRSAGEERRDEMLVNLEESVKRLEEAVADVFAIALAQSHEPSSGGRVPLRALLQQMRGDFDELALANKVAVRVIEPMPDVLVDASRVQLALLNLVTDAIKRSDRARFDRWVEIESRGRDGEGWRIEVRDNGVVFAAPSQEAHVVGEPGGGAGSAAGQPVGLAIAGEAIRQIGGRLWIAPRGAGEGMICSLVVPDAVIDTEA